MTRAEELKGIRKNQSDSAKGQSTTASIPVQSPNFGMSPMKTVKIYLLICHFEGKNVSIATSPPGATSITTSFSKLEVAGKSEAYTLDEKKVLEFTSK